MSGAAGYVLAAGGLAAANEIFFAPVEGGKEVDFQTFNWRIVPATAILAIVLTGIEKLNEGFGTGLGMLVLLSALVVPYGNAKSPLENLAGLTSASAKVV